MKVKTFHALTMQDAIRAIKAELGPDAIILSSKEVQQGGRMLRLFNRPVLEVMAAAEQEEPTMSSSDAPARRIAPGQGREPIRGVQPAESSPEPKAFQETLQSLLKPPRPSSSTRPVTPAAEEAKRPPKRDWKKERMRAMRTELQELSRLLGASLPRETQSLGSHLPSDVTIFCRGLISQGLRPSTAESVGLDVWSSLGGAPHRPDRIHDALRAVVEKRIRVTGPLLAGRGDHTVSLMLGPSGAGKTTAITKLAAHYRLEEKKNVSIITFDTYRPASVEQLRMYAAVLGVPFASAVSARQVQAGLRRHAHMDVVLIDMPGIGPEEVASAMELHDLLRDESELHIQLVVPASMRESDSFKLYDRVRHLPLLRLFFTKLDETACFGSVFELAYQTGVPLSYWTAGQRVPEDIELASGARLASFLLNQHYAAPSERPHDGSPLSSTHEMAEPVTALTGQQER
ncbi:MAG: flagellar biosynthesis protein FlhF [Nitrospiraceae bacterium]|nr:flagellar biosynthesis protein FlhF [Nitrospiraceae bacterium]